MKAQQPGDKVTGDPPGIAAMQLEEELSSVQRALQSTLGCSTPFSS